MASACGSHAASGARERAIGPWTADRTRADPSARPPPSWPAPCWPRPRSSPRTASTSQYQSPLPLPVYLAGAAATVGLSFLFVLAARRPRRAADPGHARPRRPRALRSRLRAIGLIGWLWIVAQGIAGGDATATSRRSSCGSTAGWASRLSRRSSGPVWHWLDPFATLHDLGAALAAHARRPGWAPAELPPRSAAGRRWSGSFFFVWLELVAAAAGRGRCSSCSSPTRRFTLAMMAQFGRDTWRAHGETFSVWFRVLGRLAPFGPVRARTAADPDDVDPAVASVRRVRSQSGLLDPTGDAAIVLVALGTGRSSSTACRRRGRTSTCSAPRAIPLKTLLLFAFLGAIVAAPRSRSRAA